MPILLVGSNPGALLFDESGVPLSFATLWIADWTPMGRGSAVIIADASGWRSYGEDGELAFHLAEQFTRFFPETAAFPWSGNLTHELEILEIEFNPVTRVHVVSDSIDLQIRDVLDLRTTTVERFPLGAHSPRLTNVYLPCASALLTERGQDLGGKPKVESGGERASSTAYLAIAEVWEVID
jgi:hypothetical protein